MTTAVTILLVLLGGVAVTEYARGRLLADKRVSGTALGVSTMLLASAVYFLIAVGVGTLATRF